MGEYEARLEDVSFSGAKTEGHSETYGVHGGAPDTSHLGDDLS